MASLRGFALLLALFVMPQPLTIAQTNPPAPGPSPPPSTTVPAPTPAPLVSCVVRIDQVPPIKLDTGGKSLWDNIEPVIASVASGLIAFGGVWLALRYGASNTQKTIDAAQKTAEAAINQKANEAERDAIGKKLDSFYGPYCSARRKTGYWLWN